MPYAELKGALPISTTISLVRVAVGPNNDFARSGVLPMTICTAIVSPTARASPRMTAVKIPGSAVGISTCQIVCQRVAPRATDASSREAGTERSASSEMLITVGRIMIPRINPAANRPNPIPSFNSSRRNGTSTVRPRYP